MLLNLPIVLYILPEEAPVQENFELALNVEDLVKYHEETDTKIASFEAFWQK